MSNPARVIPAALLVAAALAAWPAAAIAQTRTVAAVANYTGADRQTLLEDGARKEGALLIYTTGTQIQPLIDRFKQKYPFLRVELARAPSSDVAGKVLDVLGVKHDLLTRWTGELGAAREDRG